MSDEQEPRSDLEAAAGRFVDRAEDLAGRFVDRAGRWVREVSGDGERPPARNGARPANAAAEPGEGAAAEPGEGAAAEPGEGAAAEPREGAAAAGGDTLLPARGKMLPAPLSPFAPPDPEAERRTAARLERMTLSALRTRRQRIDRRLHELGLAIGEPALQIPSVRGTGLVDLDRVLRKLDRLDEDQDRARLEREAERAESDGVLGALRVDLDWLGNVFANREVRTQRDMLIAELGLALCACDHDVLAVYAPHVERLLDSFLPQARRIDELFVEMRLVEEELERRAREGQAEGAPKEIDRFLSKAFDSVDDVSSRVGDTLADLGRSAAEGAARRGSKGAWTLARGAATNAWKLGTRPFRGDGDPEEHEEDAQAAEPGRGGSGGPAARDVPQLIRELARLRDEGLLGPREYERKKAELLRRL